MTPTPPTADVVDDLRRSGVVGGDLVALTLGTSLTQGVALVSDAFGSRIISGDAAADVIAAIDAEIRPRWVLWSHDPAVVLAREQVRLATCWDVAAVHRLQVGGWRAEPARVWAHVHGLDVDRLPQRQPDDLFSSIQTDDVEEPVRDDGHLRPEWAADDWAWTGQRLQRWAGLGLDVARLQQQAMLARPARESATARSESTAELLCAELMVDGLPMDRGEAERIIGSLVGPRPRSESEAIEQRRRRDDEVLRLAPVGTDADLRNPAHVKSLLRRVGIEMPDTRAWRLESMRESHPIVDALLVWRKAERVATTFGYAWLDEHLGSDGRLRGDWSGSDGAAGRMTATVGLHNMPALMRPAVVAESGHLFVRADLGQIEPRVLAAVSGDAALAAATVDDDLYAPVATALGVDRATAKVAVLGAMYGQTTGHGAQALRRLDAAYPVAMQYLLDADLDGQAARDLRTYGGRAIRMGSGHAEDITERDARSRAAGRGRYGRNAMVQGAAAELFKVWAVTVRARAAALQARIVLCLHDELLVHAPEDRADDVAALLHQCLDEAAHRWAPDDAVRFVADVSVISRWSEAKS
jgi:DNA polymerase-1